MVIRSVRRASCRWRCRADGAAHSESLGRVGGRAVLRCGSFRCGTPGPARSRSSGAAACSGWQSPECRTEKRAAGSKHRSGLLSHPLLPSVVSISPPSTLVSTSFLARPSPLSFGIVFCCTPCFSPSDDTPHQRRRARTVAAARTHCSSTSPRSLATRLHSQGPGVWP